MNKLAFLPQLEEAVMRALAEDLGARGDITSRATVPASAQASFSIVAREQGVLAGRACAQLTFARVDRNIEQDRKSTRLNSSHVAISYAVFCLKKKTTFSVFIYR